MNDRPSGGEWGWSWGGGGETLRECEGDSGSAEKGWQCSVTNDNIAHSYNLCVNPRSNPFLVSHFGLLSRHYTRTITNGTCCVASADRIMLILPNQFHRICCISILFPPGARWMCISLTCFHVVNILCYMRWALGEPIISATELLEFSFGYKHSRTQ